MASIISSTVSTGIIGKVAGAAFAHAGFLAHDHRAGGFHNQGQLPVGHGLGAAGDENARGLFRENALFVFNPLLQFIADFVHRVRKPGRVVVKEDLVGQQGIQAGDGCRVGLAQG